MSITTICKVNVFSRGKESYESIFFLHNYEKNICNNPCLAYKISNPVVNGMIFFTNK